MLAVRGLCVEVGGRNVVEGATFTVEGGDKAGLVGRNGAGKTSLLRALSGQAAPAAGSVAAKGAIGYLSQDPRAEASKPGASALSHVLGGRGIDEAAARLEALRVAMETDPTERAISRFARAEERFALEGGYAAEAEAQRICAGLGIRPERLEMGLDALSGGERRRVELARILFGGADTLLLDEPTNHLDADAKEWLLAFLRSYRGALVVVSHDLVLLDSSITRVLHLERGDDAGRIVEYRGTYSSYLRARQEDEERAARREQRQQAEISRLAGLADKMRHQSGARARAAKSIDRRVGRLKQSAGESSSPVRLSKRLSMRLPPPPRCGSTVLEVEGLSKSFGTTSVFSEVSFSLGRGERMLVLGLNGAGKTTLLRILARQLPADGGEARLGLNVSAGYYAQEHEGLSPLLSASANLGMAADLSEADRRGLLGAMGLSPGVADQPAGTLSGGEKTKLALAQLVAGAHNLLLLDEPTNNLDPASRTAVGESLAGWAGSMIVVSHDPEFVEALAPDVVVVMPEGQVDRWSDDMADLVQLA